MWKELTPESSDDSRCGTQGFGNSPLVHFIGDGKNYCARRIELMRTRSEVRPTVRSMNWSDFFNPSSGGSVL